MRIVSLVLVCSAFVHDGLSMNTASDRIPVGETDQASMLTSLLVAGSPLAASTFSNLAKVSAKRKSPLKFEVEGVPVVVPLAVGGGKLTSGLEFKAKGVKFVLPLSILLHELLKLYPLIKLARPSTIKKLKGQLESPVEFDAQGLPVSVPVSFDGANLKYPLNFDAKGWALSVPLTSSLAGGLIVPLSLPKVTGKLKAPFKFAVGGLPFVVPLTFAGDKVSSGLTTSYRGFKFVLPLSFLLRSLVRLNPLKLAKPSHLKNVKGELTSPVTFDAKGVPFSIPVNVESGKIKYPLSFDVNGWSVTVPLVYSFAGAKDDGKTIADFKVNDINGKEMSLAKWKGKIVLIAVVSGAQDCDELHFLQKKYQWGGFQVVAVPAKPELFDEIKKCEVEQGLLHTSNLILLEDKKSPLFVWLKDQQKRLPTNMVNDWFLLSRSGKPVGRYGRLSRKSYEDDVAKLI